MLLYHPLYDAYNCVFRMLQLLEAHPSRVYQIDQLRIMDFYMVFPSLINQIRFPRSGLKYKKQFKAVTSYEDKSSPKVLLLRAEPYQMLAFKYLQGLGLVDEKSMENGIVKRTSKALPEDLENTITNKAIAMKERIDFLVEVLAELELSGENGLKARTDLMEYRYDA